MNANCPQCNRPIAPGEPHSSIGAVRFCRSSCMAAWLHEHGLRPMSGEPL